MLHTGGKCHFQTPMWFSSLDLNSSTSICKILTCSALKTTMEKLFHSPSAHTTATSGCASGQGGNTENKSLDRDRDSGVREPGATQDTGLGPEVPPAHCRAPGGERGGSVSAGRTNKPPDPSVLCGNACCGHPGVTLGLCPAGHALSPRCSL